MDLIVQKIGIIKNEMTHLWNALIVLMGGTIGLLFTQFTLKSLILIILGAGFSLLLFNAYMVRRTTLFELLNQLNKEKVWTTH